MAANSDKTLAQTALADMQKAQSGARDAFLNPAKLRANVVGLGIGVKWRGGEATGEPGLIVLVTHKVPKEQLDKRDLVPGKLENVVTDVMAVGYPWGDAWTPLAGRVRPAKGGYSVGHKNITAGTIASCVYDLLPGASVNPPAPGVGVPARYYILSNNHVLANSNDASTGDPILQPGPFDGGQDPKDKIAALSRFIPIALDPPTPREQHHNLVDAAIAEGHFFDLDREVYWSGPLRGWRLKEGVEVGALVKKTGRTSHFTTGRVTAVQATGDVNFGGSRVARFSDQIVTTAMSAGGDSGSLVTSLDNVAVGLLFAGSPLATIVNQIEHVRALLRVEVAERIL